MQTRWATGGIGLITYKWDREKYIYIKIIIWCQWGVCGWEIPYAYLNNFWVYLALILPQVNLIIKSNVILSPESAFFSPFMRDKL